MRKKIHDPLEGGVTAHIYLEKRFVVLFFSLLVYCIYAYKLLKLDVNRESANI